MTTTEMRLVHFYEHPTAYVGRKVFDTLTGKLVTLIGVSYMQGKKFGEDTTCTGAWAGWVDDPYLGGARHLWELDPYFIPIDNTGNL